MPFAYLAARYTMAIGITVLVWLSIPIVQGSTDNRHAVTWLRALVLPLLFTATSAVLGYRALILHFEHTRLVSLTVPLLLATELVGGVTVMTLAIAIPSNLNPRQQVSSNNANVSPAWITAPLLIALSIDAIFTLIAVVPFLRRNERPRKGQVVYMLLSDAIFFGVFFDHGESGRHWRYALLLGKKLQSVLAGEGGKCCMYTFCMQNLSGAGNVSAHAYEQESRSQLEPYRAG